MRVSLHWQVAGPRNLSEWLLAFVSFVSFFVLQHGAKDQHSQGGIDFEKGFPAKNPKPCFIHGQHALD
jgi:hypothetical protein